VITHRADENGLSIFAEYLVPLIVVAGSAVAEAAVMNCDRPVTRATSSRLPRWLYRGGDHAPRMRYAAIGGSHAKRVHGR
jgi:hypothetical protein